MKIEIKERKLTAGNRSLYLEYYETGFRKKENLHLYLVPCASLPRSAFHPHSEAAPWLLPSAQDFV